jgi:hypothetical protein
MKNIWVELEPALADVQLLTLCRGQERADIPTLHSLVGH